MKGNSSSRDQSPSTTDGQGNPTLADRNAAPTREEVDAIADRGELIRLRDDVERRIISIESQLEYSSRDAMWESRAIGALSAFRGAARSIERRLGKIDAKKPKAPKRAEKHNDALTNAALCNTPRFDPASANTVAIVDRMMAAALAYINAIERDRADEMAKIHTARDESFMAASSAALRVLKAPLHALSAKRAGLIKSDKAAAEADSQRTRAELFVEAARSVLPRIQFIEIWKLVGELQAADGAALSEARASGDGASSRPPVIDGERSRDEP